MSRRATARVMVAIVLAALAFLVITGVKSVVVAEESFQRSQQERLDALRGE